MIIQKQGIGDRRINTVAVLVTTEDDCDPKEGEYDLTVSQIIGELDIRSLGGRDDVSLIQEAISEWIGTADLPEHGITEVVLRESGEWQDVYWVKWYEVDRVNVLFDGGAP